MMEVTNTTVQISIEGHVTVVPFNTEIKAAFKTRSPENYKWMQESGFIDNITKAEYSARLSDAKQQAAAPPKKLQNDLVNEDSTSETDEDTNKTEDVKTDEVSTVVTVDGVEKDVTELESFEGITVPEIERVAQFLDLETLQARQIQERDGKNRRGALYAIQNAMDKLSG